MDSINDIDTPGPGPGGADGSDPFSVEDFLRELEEKERDLHISADMDIEIEEDPFDRVPDFLVKDLAVSAAAPIEVHVDEGASEREAELARLETRVSVLQSEITRKESARVELAEMLRRRQTDFENFKKRVERDREEQQAADIAALVKGLLPVLDNLGSALEFARPVARERSEEFRQFHEGISLVNRQMLDALSALGVEAVPGVGSAFDPSVHEAVEIEEDSPHQPNTVTFEMRRGYRLGDLVIRAAMVRVSSARQEADAPAADDYGDEDILDLGSDDSSTVF